MPGRSKGKLSTQVTQKEGREGLSGSRTREADRQARKVGSFGRSSDKVLSREDKSLSVAPEY